MAFRAFVAVEIGPSAPLGDLLTEMASLPADLKRVRPENLHVTLAFLGDLRPEAVAPLGEAVRAATAGEPPFALGLAGVGTFPPGGSPRVVWVGLDGAEPLVRIEGKLRPRLAGLGLPTGSRAFHPHLTVARSRSPRGAEEVRRWASGRARDTFGAREVRSLALFRSDLGPEGPSYTPVERYPLGEAAA